MLLKKSFLLHDLLNFNIEFEFSLFRNSKQ